MYRTLTALTFMLPLLLLPVATHTQAAGFQLLKDPNRTLLISGSIDEGSLVPLSKKLLALTVAEKPGAVDLIINSPGGRVDVGFDFISVMKHYKAAGGVIRCVVPGIAASMAFHILLHCSERHLLEESFLLWHRARVLVFSQVMTYTTSLSLAMQLGQLDSHILGDVLSALGAKEGKFIRYHFESETLHIGSELARRFPSFAKAHEAIPGLVHMVTSPNITRSEGKSTQSPTRNKSTEKPVFIYEYVRSTVKE